MTQKSIQSFDNTKITYFYTKNPQAKDTLLFIHGWPHNHTVWNKEVKWFTKKEYSTLAVDLRGHGKSNRPEKKSDYTLRKFAKDIHLIIKKVIQLQPKQ